MATNVVCGRCGAVLANPAAPCVRCGAAPWRPAAYAPSAQAARYAAPKRKSPFVAAALAVIPGMGHLYLGQPLKAMIYLLGSGGLEFFGLDLDLTVIGAAVGLPLGLTGFALWVHGIVDAYHEAKRLQAQP